MATITTAALGAMNVGDESPSSLDAKGKMTSPTVGERLSQGREINFGRPQHISQWSPVERTPANVDLWKTHHTARDNALQDMYVKLAGSGDPKAQRLVADIHREFGNLMNKYRSGGLSNSSIGERLISYTDSMGNLHRQINGDKINNEIHKTAIENVLGSLQEDELGGLLKKGGLVGAGQGRIDTNPMSRVDYKIATGVKAGTGTTDDFMIRAKQYINNNIDPRTAPPFSGGGKNPIMNYALPVAVGGIAANYLINSDKPRRAPEPQYAPATNIVPYGTGTNTVQYTPPMRQLPPPRYGFSDAANLSPDAVHINGPLKMRKVKSKLQRKSNAVISSAPAINMHPDVKDETTRQYKEPTWAKKATRVLKNIQKVYDKHFKWVRDVASTGLGATAAGATLAHYSSDKNKPTVVHKYNYDVPFLIDHTVDESKEGIPQKRLNEAKLIKDVQHVSAVVNLLQALNTLSTFDSSILSSRQAAINNQLLSQIASDMRNKN